MRVVNVWGTKRRRQENELYTGTEYFLVGEPIFVLGDFKIFGSNDNFIYTYKNIAISQLAGKNEELVRQLHADERPTGEYSPQHFLFDRAKEAITQYAEHIL